MKNNERLYGEGIEVPEIPEEIIMRRVELLNDHLSELISIDYMDRETRRIDEVLNAVNFWLKINKKEL